MKKIKFFKKKKKKYSFKKLFPNLKFSKEINIIDVKTLKNSRKGDITFDR